jgi:4-amino-4-deoxy-L-arabinose transferase-like glycosyltransferase
MKTWHWFFLVGLGISFVYFVNLFIDAMDVDATQYAAMSFEMLDMGNFLFLTDRYQNYLDKPPLTFWLVSTVYRFLGIYNWTYKLPSLLMALLAIYSTYRFSNLYYGVWVARLSALILSSTQALFLITNDCRTDTILMGTVAFSLWQLGAYLKDGKAVNFVGAFVAIGLSMLAKGPIGLIMPILAFGPHLLIKNPKAILRWRWLLGLALVAVVIFPMCLGLYLQYDANPEVQVNGQKGVSGLHFYFWKQSFGRITGESEWKDDSDAFFFVHTFGWAFLPWTLFAIAALFDRMYSAFRRSGKTTIEWASFFGFLLPWIAFSLSKYKLPHYIFVFFPMAAVLTAQYLTRLYYNRSKVFGVLSYFHGITLWLMWLVPVLILVFVFEIKNYFAVILACFAFIGFVVSAFQKEKMNSLLLSTAFCIVGINIILSLHFYPQLLPYQAGIAVGRFVKQNQWKPDVFISYKGMPHSLDFYSRQINTATWELQGLKNFAKGKPFIYVYGNRPDIEELKKEGFEVEVLLELPHFHVSELNFTFLNAKTRYQAVQTHQVVKLTAQSGALDITAEMVN